MKKTSRLKDLILQRRALLVPGVYDALSARIAESLGFQAVQVSGFGLAASVLGGPDIGLLTMTEMLGQT
ncbi:MAG: isocitrate lyase/phosphoenolpyruvate mutase family protein, partial [bacterium]